MVAWPAALVHFMCSSVQFWSTVGAGRAQATEPLSPRLALTLLLPTWSDDLRLPESGSAVGLFGGGGRDEDQELHTREDHLCHVHTHWKTGGHEAIEFPQG